MLDMYCCSTLKRWSANNAVAFLKGEEGAGLGAWPTKSDPAPPLLMALLALALLVPHGRLTVIPKHIDHGRERVVYHLYLVDVPVYALMPFAFLRQGTSPSPQRGGLCEAHRIWLAYRKR